MAPLYENLGLITNKDILDNGDKYAENLSGSSQQREKAANTLQDYAKKANNAAKILEENQRQMAQNEKMSKSLNQSPKLRNSGESTGKKVQSGSKKDGVLSVNGDPDTSIKLGLLGDSKTHESAGISEEILVNDIKKKRDYSKGSSYGSKTGTAPGKVAERGLEGITKQFIENFVNESGQPPGDDGKRRRNIERKMSSLSKEEEDLSLFFRTHRRLEIAQDGGLVD